MQILALSGSLRKESFNTALLRSLQAFAPEGMVIQVADIGALPLYNQDAEAAFPSEAKALKNAIEAADGIIVATPEYNRSVPGVLKNAIDWASRPWGQNSFAGKPVLTMGVSVGKIGTAVAQSHLRQILAYLDTRIVGQPELYFGPANEVLDENGAIKSDAVKDLLTKALQALSARAS